MNFENLKDYKEEFETIEEARLGGKFICENSLEVSMQNAYKLISLNKSIIEYYYSILSYRIVFESGFCYFVKEHKTDSEATRYDKQFLDNFIEYIDIHKFLKTLDSSFISENNYTFNISALEERLNNDMELKTTANKMAFIKKKSTHREFLEQLLVKLRNDGFVESFNSREGKYRLLKSYKYIEDIIEGIVIDE